MGKSRGGNIFDVALVCWDAASHAAALAERERLGAWPTDLDETLKAEAERLARHVQHGELALFLGAGVSMAAGLPNWKGLLDLLAVRAGMTVEERNAIGELRNVLDQATLIERRLKARGDALGAVIASVMSPHRYHALTHALLAALPVREAITTNYDRLFEDAWAHVDSEGLSIIPGSIRPDARRWLLKMHGCLSDPERIAIMDQKHRGAHRPEHWTVCRRVCRACTCTCGRPARSAGFLLRVVWLACPDHRPQGPLELMSLGTRDDSRARLFPVGSMIGRFGWQNRIASHLVSWSRGATRGTLWQIPKVSSVARL